MSVTTTYPFTIQANYDFDTDKIEVSAGEARLNLLDLTGETFPQAFIADTGFTYDSGKAEFTGSLLQPKIYIYADEMFRTTQATGVATADYALGSTTATANNGATVTDISGTDYLDISGGIVDKSFFYDFNNANFLQTGAVRFKVITGYGATPTADRFLITLRGLAEINNIVLFHQSSGDLSLRIKDESGVLVSNTNHPWTPNGVNEDEIELNVDVSTGATRVFINGTQSGPTATVTFSRGAITEFTVGIKDTVNSADFYIRDFQVFTDAQHTTDFSGEVPRTVYNFYGSPITTPEYQYTGVGNIQAFETFATTETGTPRYIIQIGQSGDYLYWDGVAWSISAETYAESNDVSTFNTNAVSLPVSGEVYFQYKMLFDDARIASTLTLLTSTITGQVYPQDNPTIEPNSGVRIEELIGFVADTTIAGSDNITYIIKKDTLWYYWDGAAWSVSAGTYAESNLITDIVANIAAFTTSAVDVKIKIFLHSNDGSTTPTINELAITYDFAGDAQDALYINTVWWYARNPDGTACTDDIIIQPSVFNVRYKDNVFICQTAVTVNADSTTGYIEAPLISNVAMVDSNTNAVTYTVYKGVINSRFIIAIISVPESGGSLLWDIEI